RCHPERSEGSAVRRAARKIPHCVRDDSVVCGFTRGYRSRAGVTAQPPTTNQPNPPMSRMHFDLLATDGPARRGRLTFPRGTVETPAFMPVGTYGTVKGMLPGQVRDIGAQIILGNTFHLFLRPGLDVIEAHGGLHGFARWDG